MDPLSCRTCGAPMRAADLDRRLAIITCGSCGAIFDLARRKDREEVAGPLAEAPAPARAPVALPSNFTVLSRGMGLKVARRWFRPAELMLLPFAIAWDAFLIFWYATALGIDGTEGPVWLMIVFPLAHVAVGVGITYRAIANLVNRTLLEVSPKLLKIWHAPLPWWPTRKVPVHELEQLFCTRKVSHGKNGTRVSFQLRAVTRKDATLLLLGGLPELDQALWLEQEIEEQLGLRDRPVAGEVKDQGVQL